MTVDTNVLMNKWAPILDESEVVAPIKDTHRKKTLAQVLENTDNTARSEPREWAQFGLVSEAAPTNNISGGNIAAYDPIIVSLLRRSMPNLMAYDLCGVQAMTGPTGLIFAMRSRYNSMTGTETFYNEVNTAFSSVTAGNTTLGQAHTGSTPTGNTSTYNAAGGMSTATLEALGSSGGSAFPEMGFSIESVMVRAQGRALKAEYSMELAQDLKALHGLDAETELANILTSELLAEINREIVRKIQLSAVPGAQDGTATAGVFDLDTDSNGRWFGEKFKGMIFQIERETNALAKSTRRGKGNILICSSDVASALQMAGVLTYTPAIAQNNNLTVDDTGNTFVGLLNGKIKVYIDPYAAGQYMVVGYKGQNTYDAGLFYCPYVPLQMVRAVGQDTFQPKIGFKTRYGLVANPYSTGATPSDGTVTANANIYYRRIAITNLF
jgi:hypothetical protein